MRTTNHTARGIPLAVLLLLLAWTSWAVMGEGTLRIDQALSPNEIYVVGTEEEPESATLTLEIQALGPVIRYPIDCLFVIDASATSDVIQAAEFAFDLIDQLGVDDRAGLVSYGTTAELDMPLTHNLGAVKLSLADLTARGKSAMGLAMQMARREFDQVGREDAILVEILISDGQNSVGVEPDMEGKAAAQIGIKIMSVGLGTLINRNMLDAFAEETGGQFFQSPTDRARTDIFMDLDVFVAAGDLEIE
ncbi:VWA domain-containing protein [Candidatus Bipolaricaulota bacterium]|nr:VWA domain-containing protein [Candidatus Bipolaricaulota bacterium]